MTTQLFYLGPELTFSHEAAEQMRQRQPGWSAAELVARPSAAAIFQAVLEQPHSGAVVPIFNFIQGDVIDFLRFLALEKVDQLELAVDYGLFSQKRKIEDIERIYTKDTVIPQISEWVKEELPNHIDLISSLTMSTAEAAARAAEDSAGGAICASAAGHAHGLHLVTPIAADRPGNFTRFALFVRPDDWWPRPAQFLESFEHPLGFDDELWQRVRRGQETFYWSVALHDDSHLHLDHLSLLLTLRKVAGWGNQTVILLQRGLVDDHQLYNYWNGLLAVMGKRPVDVQVDAQPQAGWIEVASIEKIQVIKKAGRSALLLDPVPGVDGYAKMSARRGNTVSWPIRPEEAAAIPLLPLIEEVYFGMERLAAAGFDWQWGAY